MTMHESWTDKLSDYLDDELAVDERAAVDAHLGECAECTRTLAELQEVVARAAALRPALPPRDLWNGIAETINSERRSTRAPRRFSFTLPELAAAGLLLAMLSGGGVALWLTRQGAPAGVARDASEVRNGRTESTDALVELISLPGAVPASDYGDAQYDAAVADLERALRSGRGRLDETTVAVVEENLAIIDRAIAEARNALGTDPSNSYLSGHLMQAQRRKLALLRQATALTAAN
jgi:anti-sigma factor RsiW